jgi:hypothetical protein
MKRNENLNFNGENSIIIGKYEINDNGTIDVYGDVRFLSKMKYITAIPFRFNKVTGDFDCSHLSLKNLEGCPVEVGGTFDCSHNQLSTLEWAPKKVGGIFIFDDTVRSLYTGNKSCNFNKVLLLFRGTRSKQDQLPKIITNNAIDLPIIFKYQMYYSIYNYDQSINEDNMKGLLTDILDGLA